MDPAPRALHPSEGAKRDCPQPSERKSRRPVGRPPRHSSPEVDESFHIEVDGFDEQEDSLKEEVEAESMRKHTLVTDGRTSWSQVCKHMNSLYGNIPFESRI